MIEVSCRKSVQKLNSFALDKILKSPWILRILDCIYSRTTDAKWSLFSTISQTFGPNWQIDRINFGIFGVLSPLILALWFLSFSVFFSIKTLLFRPNPNIPNMILVDNNLGYSHHASLVSLFTNRLVPSHSYCKYLLIFHYCCYE